MSLKILRTASSIENRWNFQEKNPWSKWSLKSEIRFSTCSEPEKSMRSLFEIIYNAFEHVLLRLDLISSRLSPSFAERDVEYAEVACLLYYGPRSLYIYTRWNYCLYIDICLSSRLKIAPCSILEYFKAQTRYTNPYLTQTTQLEL